MKETSLLELSPASDISFHPQATFLSSGADLSFTQGRHGCAIEALRLAQGRADPPPKGYGLCCFRLLSDAGSAIIRPVSRKAILGTCFDMCMLDEIRARRDEIYAIARAHKAEKLWVFGSCARKEVVFA